MAKKKLQHFAEVETFSNVFQHMQHGPELEDLPLKGKWNEEYFKNNNPIVLEVGCGKGEYTIGLAERFPEKNFIGADLKGARIWRGSKTAIENNMKNVAFLRVRIEQIEKMFAKGEISEIWITFPDPQPQEKREKKRLTSPRFIAKYKNILTPEGKINLKTDSEFFYNYTMEVIKQSNYKLIESTNNLYDHARTMAYSDELESLLNIKTYYEQKFTAKGFNICYAKFEIS